MTIETIIKQAIAAAGGDGLCNTELDCGCAVDELAPCNAVGMACEVARSRILGAEERVGECGPGDRIFDPVQPRPGARHD